MSSLSLNLIKSSQWYRQQTEATPYFIYLPCRGCLEYFKSQDKIFWYCDLEEARAYLEQNYIRTLAEQYLNKEKLRPNFSKNLHAGWLKDVQEKNRCLFRKVDRVDIKELKNQELLKINRSLGQQSYAMWLKFFMDIFDIDAESLIEQELIKEKIILSADEKNIMTMPLKPIVHQEQELELLKIVKLVKSDSNYIYLLKQILSADKIHRLKLYPKLLNSIEAYVKKYHWIRNSWADVYIISAYEVVDQIQQIIIGSRDVEAEIRKLNNYQRDLIRQKKLIAKKHHLSKWLVRMFTMFSLIALWRDERKVQMQQLHYYLQLIGTEIAKRSKISWEQIKVCDPLSISRIPVKPKDLIKYTKLLKNNKLMSWQGKTVRHFSSQISKKFVKVLEATFSTEMTEIRGLIACPGKVIGEVVVINKKSEFSKMKPGKILVTTMTRPDFMPLMRQAAAVVTDEGGITSHAAIISRELKIPCIIGTKVGTKVLHDGYQVEVNANHGVVLVLENKNL